MLALYAVTRWRGGSMSAEEVEAKKAPTSGRAAERILVLANQTLVGEQLHNTLLGIDGSDRAEYLVVVPANPVDTGQADREGAAFVWEATTRAAQQRLEETLATLQARGLTVRGELGDLPTPDRARGGSARVQARSPGDLHALRGALDLAAPRVVDEARKRHDDIDIEHVVVEPVQAP